jgi:hypothetical protein
MNDLSEVTKMIGHWSSLQKFLQTGQVERTLATLGGSEFDAARLALRHAASSGYPRREIESAIGHLRSALMAYRKVWSSPGFVTVADEAAAEEGDIWACCLIALCYAYLGEGELMRKYLDEAEVPMKFGADKSKRSLAEELTRPKNLMQTAGIYFSPIKHYKWFKAPVVTAGKLNSFRRNLEVCHSERKYLRLESPRIPDQGTSLEDFL